MPFETDERLKSYLDSNQQHREQLSLAVLAIDPRYSDPRPRHPRGGPDGGRDIEATFRGELRVFGAVGFINQANDSTAQKRRIAGKFEDDLKRALEAEPGLKAFVFLPNIDLTAGEEDALVDIAKDKGLEHCEVFDRERLRIALDSPDGLAARFQFLRLPLSEAEQASFFARWGDDIQSVIATGFQKMESRLARVLFLEESRDPFNRLTVVVKLDRQYEANEIGHFRLFCDLWLKEQKDGVVGLLFGISDRAGRFRTDSYEREDAAGIRAGIGGGQWQKRLVDEAVEAEDDPKDEYVATGSLSSVGMETVEYLSFAYSDDPLIRFEPGLSLRDLNDASFILVSSKGLAEKLTELRIYAGGYEILRIGADGIQVDESEFPDFIPAEFSESELQDPWVRVRPSSGSSVFHLRFYEKTPRRLVAPEAIGEDRDGT